MLIQEARDRNDAIDRLLGLTDYRNILSGIDAAKVARSFRELSSEKDNIAHDIDFAIKQRLRDLGELQDQADVAGIRDTDLTSEGGLALAASLCGDISDFLSRSGLADISLHSPESIADLGVFCRSARRSLSQARTAIPVVSQQEELLSKRSSVVRLQQSLKSIDTDSQALRNEVRSYERKHQSLETIEQAVNVLSEREASLSGRLRSLNARAPLIREGIAILESEEDSAHCPLCGSAVADLLSRLQREWENQIGTETENLQIQIDECTAESRELVEVLRDWRDANASALKLSEDKAALRVSVSEILKTPVNEETDIATTLTEELGAVQEALNSIEQSVGVKMRAIDEIEEQVERVELVQKLLEERDRIARISQIRESEDFELMEERFAELAHFAADLDVIKDAIASASNAEAEGMVRESGDFIDEYFRQIAEHPAVKRVVLEVVPDRRSGRNAYSFVDQDAEDLLPVLSQGDLNSLALSIFLGLSTTAAGASPFGFVLLDDPSQSLGSEEKERLAGLLNSVSHRVKVAVATMDAEFASALSRTISVERLTTYQFQGWSPTGGPVIQEAPIG